MFFTKTNPCRKHTDAYRGLKAAPKYSALTGPDKTRALQKFHTPLDIGFVAEL